MEITALRDLIPQYPEDAPQTLTELAAADVKDLTDDGEAGRRLVQELRRQTIDAIHAFEREPILCPDDLTRQLSGRRIPMLARRWTVICLDRSGDRIAVHRSRGGGLRWLQETYKDLPEAGELAAHLRLPAGGRYLFVYGGGPDVLTGDGTADRLTRLARELPVSDVTMWWLRTGQAPTLMSVRGQCGDQAGEMVPFDEAPPAALIRALTERNDDGR